MKILQRTSGSQVAFILAELDPDLRQAARELQFRETSAGFAKFYAAETPGLEGIYENFRACALTMLRQKAGLQAVPWQESLEALLERIAGHRLNWFLCGSAALAVRGLDIVPGDIDLVLDDSSALKLGELLSPYLVEPVIPVRDWLCNWWGRAFWRARIEWLGGVKETADQPEASDFGPEAERRIEIITWQGYRLRLPPLDLQLAVMQRRGLRERATIIQKMLRGDQ